MKISNDNKEFLKTINNTLNQRVDEIDDFTKDALRNIRKEAMAQATNKTTNTWQWLRPVPIMAAASIVLVVSVSLRTTMTTPVQPAPALQDIPILTAAEDFDFYNDLEFYQWLEAENLHG